MAYGRWLAVILVIIGASSYGFLSSFVKMAYKTGFNEAQITSAQMTMGTVLLWILVAVNKKSWVNPFRGPWIKLALIGIFGVALTTVCYNFTLTKLNASLAIVMLFQFTWMTIALDCAVRRRIPGRNEVGAILLIMLGTLFAVNLFGADWSQLSGIGILFGLLSGFTYCLFLFLTGQVKSDLPPLMKSSVMMTATIPIIYIVYPPSELFQGNSGNLLLWGLLLGFLGHVVPTVAFNIGIPRIGSTLAAMLGSVELPVAVIAAFLIIGEPVLLIQWLGMFFILAGILLSEKRSKVKDG